jgi:hypothetical protein
VPGLQVDSGAAATEFVCHHQRQLFVRSADGGLRRDELLRYIAPVQLTELIMAAGRPPLAYSLPAFHPSSWQQAPYWLEVMCGYGFRWVTLHPTYSVADRLCIGTGPDAAEPLRVARSLGLRVRLEPHLDYKSSLTGGPYRWRRDMLIEPAGEYFDKVLAPSAGLQPDELTLGSELDDSADAFPDQWFEVASRLSGLTVGHKLNHDWLAGERTVEYLKTLDYVALSWYVPDLRPLPEGYVIGEFGLGSADVMRPWHFDASTFGTPEALAVRRTWYLERVQWLERTVSPGAACFWTAGHFDVLGIMDEQWRDDAIVEAVRFYNCR